MVDDFVEVRIPTYKRPDWLAHAIRSLVAQDNPNWKAVVFDDSPAHEAEIVVNNFNDPRLVYRPNPENLGASKNLNQCFSNKPYIGGRYAFVLEDDNWLLPDFISSNLKAIESLGVNFIHRNQEIWLRDGNNITKQEGNTLSRRYSRKVMTPVQLHAHVFFWPGVSNGALFFRTGTKSNLQVDSPEMDPSLQEYLRCVAIEEDSAFLEEPKAVFATMPTSATARHYADPKYFSAYVRELQVRTLKRHGSSIVDEAFQINAQRYNNSSWLRRVLANVNALSFSDYLKDPRLLKLWATGIFKSIRYRSKVDENLTYR